ncbi:phage antirepressor KilAC domain-containing protein [Klebsiella aerogenes]|nr:phage antirepressor KilAC domain-containing protein [Klebsiella aerogenes]
MLLPANKQTASITSLEISELVRKRHDNVKRTIATLAESGVIRAPQIEVFEEINNLRLTVKRERFIFAGEQGKRDSIIVVAQLSPEFTARLVDRWQELEASSRPAIPQTLPEALRLAADLAEQKAEVESQLALAAPKAAFVDSYVNAKGLMTFRQVAKVLKVKEGYLSAFLMDKGIMYRLNGKLTAHHIHINAGRFSTKTGESGRNGRAFVQTYFTAKGVNWLAGLLEAEKKDSAA